MVRHIRLQWLLWGVLVLGMLLVLPVPAADTISVNLTGWWIEGSAFHPAPDNPIQAGLTNATDGSTIVLVQDTEFPFPVTIGAGVPNNITFDLGSATLNGSALTTQHGITVDGRTNVTVRNGSLFKYYYGLYVLNSASITLSSLQVRNTANCGLFLNGAVSNLLVDAVTITSPGADGMSYRSTGGDGTYDTLTIYNSTILNPTGYGVLFFDYNNAWNYLKNLQMDNVTVQNAGSSGIYVSQERNPNSENITILNSSVTGSKYHGYEICYSRGTLRLENNRAESNGLTGGGGHYGFSLIAQSISSPFIFSGNRIEKNRNGIYLQNFQDFAPPSLDYVKENQGTVYQFLNVKNVTIDDPLPNTNPANVIYALDSVQNFTVRNSTLSNTLGAYNTGVLITGGSSNVTLDSVTASHPSQYGVFLSAGMTNLSLNNVFVNNAGTDGIALQNGGWTGAYNGITINNSIFLDSAAYGIRLYDNYWGHADINFLKNVSLDNVTVKNSGASGVYLYQGSHPASVNVSIKNSILQNNAFYGSDIYGRGTIVFENNTLENNGLAGTGYWGLSLMSTGSPVVTFSRNTIRNNPNGCTFASISTNLNDSFMENTLVDIALGSSHINSYNSTFTKSKTTLDGASILATYWGLTVHVVDPGLTPVPATDVNITDTWSNSVFNGQTDGTGSIPALTLNEWIKNGTAEVFNSPFLVRAQKNGVGTNETSLVLNRSENLTVILRFTPPVANFTASPTIGIVPLAVQFNDTSTGGTPVAWNWSFGDGFWFNTTEVALVNTSHNYTIDGSFTPQLTVSNDGGSSTQSGMTITVHPPPPVASFSASPTTGILPLTVLFNDTSTGGKPTAWNWSFGDGSWFNTTEATLANTTWVYSAEGTFNATLTVSNGGGSNTSAVTAITVLPIPPVASFTAIPANGTVPLDVQFNDTSTGGTSTAWNWSFGDGFWFNTTDADQRNTTHRFGSRGHYIINLTVSNPGGSNTTTPGTTVTVTDPPTASFSYSPVTGYAPLPVQFNDTSSSDTLTHLRSWNWSFDGGTSWTTFTDPALRNMTHTFPAAGTFTAALKVSDANNGNSTVNHTITVLQPTMNITSITPAKGTIGTTVPVTIAGTNFTSTPAMKVNLTRGPEVIQATEIKVTVPNKITCKFVIPLGASGGSWNLSITRPNGDYGTKTNAFNVSVLKDPKISAITPTSGYVNTTTAFSLAGSNFIPGSVVTFSNSTHAITAVLDPITKSSKITGNLTTNASSLLGKWNISIVLPDGRSSVKTYAYTLKPWAKPAVSSMMPSSGYPNMTYTFSISGNLFEKPNTVVVLTRGVPGEFIPTTLTSVNLNKIMGTVFIPAGTVEMKWNLSVTTPDGGTTIKNGVFTVKPWPKPGISSINQTKGVHGSTISYAISGTNFQPGSTVTFTNSSAAGLNFTAGVSTLTASKITGAVTIPANRIGKYGIEVICPDGKVASKANAFTIT